MACRRARQQTRRSCLPLRRFRRPSHHSVEIAARDRTSSNGWRRPKQRRVSIPTGDVGTMHLAMRRHKSVAKARTLASYFLINAAVSIGRRNTKLEVYLQESQKLKSFASVESNGHYPG